MNEIILQQRHARLRALMAERGLDGIVFLSPGQEGFGAWLCGTGELPSLPPFGRTNAYLLPREGEVISWNTITPHPTDPVQAPVFERLDLFCTAPGGTFGAVNLKRMKLRLREQIQTAYPKLTLVDITAEVCLLKAEKSPEEVAQIREAARLYDRLFSALPLILREGRLEQEIAVDLRHRLAQLGADAEDLAVCSQLRLTSAPQGAASVKPPAYPGRRLAYGDRVNLELNGGVPGGLYCAAGRSYTLGPAADGTRADWALAVRAQRLAAERLRPGVTLSEVTEAVHREILLPAGAQNDSSAWLYGIGCGRYEIPRNTDCSRDLPVRAGMVLVIGPHVRRQGQDSVCCADLYAVTTTGCERLSQLPQALIELD